MIISSAIYSYYIHNKNPLCSKRGHHIYYTTHFSFRASLRKPNGVVQRLEGVNLYKEIFIF